jgi:AcrR family transcriptional regulator
MGSTEGDRDHGGQQEECGHERRFRGDEQRHGHGAALGRRHGSRVYETLCLRQERNVSTRSASSPIGYAVLVPRLWNQTIQAHRHQVRDAILDTTAALVAEHGLRPVTMLQIAERTGIGRATLYKYFPDVEAILVAWHQRHVTAHLDQLTAIRDRADTPGARLDAVLHAYAHIRHGQAHQAYGTELAALVHRDPHVAKAQRQVDELIRDLLADAAEDGDVRDDVPPPELATYCRRALDAAADLMTKAAVGRLVTLVRAGLRPPGDDASPG